VMNNRPTTAASLLLPISTEAITEVMMTMNKIVRRSRLLLVLIDIMSEGEGVPGMGGVSVLGRFWRMRCRALSRHGQGTTVIEFDRVVEAICM